MAVKVRLATQSDAPQWLELLLASLGEDYPAKEVYDLAWVAAELGPESGHETWVAEAKDSLHAAISLLKPDDENTNPVVNLGRCLNRPSSYGDGSAEALLQKVNQLSRDRQQMIVARVTATDTRQQILFESSGFVCAGFQPAKHLLKTRRGFLFYLSPANPVLVTRSPLSDSLSQISELATLVLESLKIPTSLTARDGVTGYPLSSDLTIHDAIYDDFELWRLQAQSTNPVREISSGFNRGAGLMRIQTGSPFRAMLGQREAQIVSGLAYFYDEHDRCVRILDAFASDFLSVGPLLAQVIKIAHEQLSADYVEVDILMNARRLLKSAEQLGFVPVAYLPAFCSFQAQYADVVKMVKLNLLHAPEELSLTAHAANVVKLIDSSIQDLKVGVAVLNLLRSLPIFAGLGDGELRKMGRFFSQKLYRPGEAVFKKGDAGTEAYIVLRGQVDILLDEKPAPLAMMQSGQIFGELAFLDRSARLATAVASQPTILLVIQRTAFNDLAQNEPHLGMVVLGNIAKDLSSKLRRTTNDAFNTGH